MHNGQIGGFESVRKTAYMLIPDQLYLHRRGATDSEVFFLVTPGDGLDSDPIGAIIRTIQIFKALATKSPKFRMTAALSDGKRLFVGRLCLGCARAQFISPLECKAGRPRCGI